MSSDRLSVLSLLRPELSQFGAYVPDADHYPVRLDANEAPPFLSPEGQACLVQGVQSTAFQRYPDAAASELKASIAMRSGVSTSEVLVGAGSDELLAILLSALGEAQGRSPRSVVTTSPTFVMYRMTARLRGLPVVEVPLDREWDLAEESLLIALKSGHPGVVFVASPNNPTSNLVNEARLRRLIEASPDWLFVIDEAYIDYSDRTQLSFYFEYENVVILRTLSKIGFAALRVGWMIGRKPLVAELDKLRMPFNVSSLSQKLATLALTELSLEVTASCARVREERALLSDKLKGLPGVSVTASQANFLWVRTERPAGEVYDALKHRGILVRSFHQRGGRLAHQLRITIGSHDENQKLLHALSEVV